MNDCTVDGCIRPAEDFVCRTHQDELRVALRDLADDLLTELNVTRWRLSRSTANTGTVSRSATSALMFHATASSLADTAANSLRAWAREVHADQPELRHPGSAATPRELAGWLSLFVGRISVMPDGGQLADEVIWLAKEVRKVIDTQPMNRFLGICSTLNDDREPCEADLYAPPDKAFVQCRECGSLHDVEERRRILLNAVGSQKGTVTELARALPDLLGRPISVESVKTWVRKGQLIPAGRNERGHSLFLVDDLVALVITKQTRRRGKVTLTVVSA
ncbi:hypothetical protein ACIOD2_27160 [Amycolatopsis sp. NPDC088138]|uniref:hypothetical protein n=1 Tax=Amycolatopsis sp. NPDC088138 TaxID=3363938 RepID=UPI0038016338